MPHIKELSSPVRAAVLSAAIALGMCLTAAPAEAATTGARSLLFKVSWAAESNSGYDRAKFGGWIDANRDCQNTRHEVLIS